MYGETDRCLVFLCERSCVRTFVFGVAFVRHFALRRSWPAYGWLPWPKKFVEGRIFVPRVKRCVKNSEFFCRVCRAFGALANHGGRQTRMALGYRGEEGTKQAEARFYDVTIVFFSSDSAIFGGRLTVSRPGKFDDRKVSHG